MFLTLPGWKKEPSYSLRLQFAISSARESVAKLSQQISAVSLLCCSSDGAGHGSAWPPHPQHCREGAGLCCAGSTGPKEAATCTCVTSSWQGHSSLAQSSAALCISLSRALACFCSAFLTKALCMEWSGGQRSVSSISICIQLSPPGSDPFHQQKKNQIYLYIYILAMERKAQPSSLQHLQKCKGVQHANVPW